MRDGAFKAPPLRNVELTGPFFHTGSYLTLRQVVDFYFEGGDFPGTNSESRDPHVVNLELQAFAFGPSQGSTSSTCSTRSTARRRSPTTPRVPVLGQAAAASATSSAASATACRTPRSSTTPYPDSNHPLTPEPVRLPSRRDGDAKNALVKFLIALTDPRVKLESAPFDRPEIFVPIDGMAPDNTGGPMSSRRCRGFPARSMKRAQSRPRVLPPDRGGRLLRRGRAGRLPGCHLHSAERRLVQLLGRRGTGEPFLLGSNTVSGPLLIPSLVGGG